MKKRGLIETKTNKFYVMTDHNGIAYVYDSAKAWIIHFMDMKGNEIEQIVRDLENPPEWAKSFSFAKDQKMEFKGKEELIKAFKGLEYKMENVNIKKFLCYFEPDWSWYVADYVKRKK